MCGHAPVSDDALPTVSADVGPCLGVDLVVGDQSDLLAEAPPSVQGGVRSLAHLGSWLYSEGYLLDESFLAVTTHEQPLSRVAFQGSLPEPFPALGTFVQSLRGGC